jgi:hypothetical protein
MPRVASSSANFPVLSGSQATFNSLNAGTVNAWGGITVTNASLFNDDVLLKRGVTIEGALVAGGTRVNDIYVLTDQLIGSRTHYLKMGYTPALSGPDACTIYMDKDSKTLKVSQSGGAYQDLVQPAAFRTFTATTTDDDTFSTVASITFGADDMKILRVQIIGKNSDSSDKETYAMGEFISGFYVGPDNTLFELGQNVLFRASKGATGQNWRELTFQSDFDGLTWNLQTRSLAPDQTMSWTVKVYGL